MKKMYLAYPRGFCAGVRRALETVEVVLKKYHGVVHVYHEIVHNNYVVEKLRRKGVVFVNNINDVPQGGVIVFSAHGVSHDVEQKAAKRQLKTIDATCPLVKKIHNQGAELIRKGYLLFLIGHKKHPEIIGTLGQLHGDAFVIENKEQVAKAAKGILREAKVAYLTQTTLSVNDTRDIVNELKKFFPSLEGSSSICYATTNRQNAIKMLATKCDTVLVIGSAKSSNSNRLREVAEVHGARAFLIDNYKDITPQMLRNTEITGISAGASAPDCLVHELCQYLQNNGWLQPVLVESDSENITFKIPDINL